MNDIVISSPVTENDFKAYYKLRWRILRQPWQQPEGSERDSGDIHALHYMVKINNEVAGVARLHLNAPLQAQLRYMAVSEQYQNKGIGKALLTHIEQEAKKNGAHELILQARENAVEFYKQCGYKKEKKTYILFGSIQHYLMTKTL